MTRSRLPLVLLWPVTMAAGIFVLPAGDASQPRRPAPAGSQAAGGAEDAVMRRRLVGVWQDDYEGKRTMTLNEDGTGTMLVELSGAKAVLFASTLRFDLEWSLAGGKLTKRTTGGEPSVRVNLILRTMGDTTTEPVLELTGTRLLLLDKNGKTQYDWRRAE